MVIDMVESLRCAFNPNGDHDDDLPAKAAPVLILRPSSYTLNIAKMLDLIDIRNMM
jgi:hypothetical protein